MKFSPGLESLIEALACLPGVGRKTAQRMAFHLLERDRDGATNLSRRLGEAIETIGHCRRCRMFTEQELCEICVSERRDPSVLCIVEGPADIAAIEQGASYNGRYFVLMGHLSPLDGIGPDELGLPELKALLAAEPVREMIIATNSTVEGEATAHFLAELAHAHNIPCSRIAHGVPLGGELEYVDGGTLSQAISERRPM